MDSVRGGNGNKPDSFARENFARFPISTGLAAFKAAKITRKDNEIPGSLTNTMNAKGGRGGRGGWF